MITVNMPKIAAVAGISGTEEVGEVVGEGEAVGVGTGVAEGVGVGAGVAVWLVVDNGATVGCGV